MDKTRNNIRGFIKISDVTNANNPEIIVQKENAIHYEKKGCCWLLQEEEFNQNKLTTLLLKR